MVCQTMLWPVTADCGTAWCVALYHGARHCTMVRGTVPWCAAPRSDAPVPSTLPLLSLLATRKSRVTKTSNSSQGPRVNPFLPSNDILRKKHWPQCQPVKTINGSIVVHGAKLVCISGRLCLILKSLLI